MPEGQRRRGREDGFTVVELTIAAALGLLIMLAALGAVVEGQRSLNTVMSRSQDVNAAQSLLSRIALGVRDASAVGIVSSAPQSQLWLETTSGTCAEWIFTGSPTNALELSSGTSHSSMSSPSVELSGVTSGAFTGFANYAGLVDVTLSVLRSSSSSANGYQAASSAVKLEAQSDDPTMSGAVGSGYPGSC
jgi:Tfp pilus assembly protein PilW